MNECIQEVVDLLKEQVSQELNSGLKITVFPIGACTFIFKVPYGQKSKVEAIDRYYKPVATYLSEGHNNNR